MLVWLTLLFRCISLRSLSLHNEPILEFKPGSPEREAVEKCLPEIESKTEEIPIMIGDEPIWTSDIKYQVCVSFFFDMLCKCSMRFVVEKSLGLSWAVCFILNVCSEYIH